MDVVKVHKVRRYKCGYEVRDEDRLTHFEDKPKDDTFRMRTAYTPSGDYIGNPTTAKFLVAGKGIQPQLAHPDDNVCSIGYSVKDGKWWGWSHRATYGFKVGSVCKKGECHYKPANRQDFKEDCIRFWSDEDHLDAKATFTKRQEPDGPNIEYGVLVSWKYADTVPNAKLRGEVTGIFTRYPDSWGRGEWTAETTADAKRMAVDFAEGAS